MMSSRRQTDLAGSIATAKPFRFLIGHAAVEFFAHPAIVAQQSISLATLVNGKMREARDGYACIEDVDEDTFARFLEYCYTEDYPAAEHAVVLDAASIQQESPVDSGDNGVVSQQEDHADTTEPEAAVVPIVEQVNWPGFQRRAELNDAFDAGQNSLAHPDASNARRTKKAKTISTSSTRRAKAWKAFTQLSWVAPPEAPKSPTYDARVNGEACEDYTDVFLSHARLYVFADTYSIEKLRVLSLQKLHKCLVNFTLFPERVTDVAMLLQYAYQHTPECNSSRDDLRALLIGYVCCNLEHIRRNDVFKETLNAENASSVDLLELLLPRLD